MQKKIVHALISLRMDYCNAPLYETPSKHIHKLQYIQNSAAQILMRQSKQLLSFIPFSGSPYHFQINIWYICLLNNAYSTWQL